MLASLFETRAVRDPQWDLWGQGADGPMGGNTAAGVQVSEASALQLLTVYGCVAFKSDAISVLPICVYRETSAGREEIKAPSWVNEPNPDLAGPDLISQAVTSLELDGNFFAIPVRDSVGQVVEVYPLHPGDVSVSRWMPGQRPSYKVFGKTVPPNTVLHVKSFTLPGEVRGCSSVAYMRQTIGSGLVMEEFAGRFFGQGSAPSGIIETPAGPDLVNAGMLREQFEAFHRGVKKSHGVAVLTGGATYKPITIAPEDAQFLETRNFTAAQIAAGIYRIYPDMVGATLPGGSSITYQNITDRWVELTRRAFLPTCSRLEWAFTWRLLPRPQVAKFDIDEYQRADIATRFDAYSKGIAAGFLTVADVREEEDLPPIPEPVPAAVPGTPPPGAQL